MPRLVKGGKWVYGWVIVGPERKVTIPPEAWREYGFQTGDEAIFIPGSRRSGGFGISTPGLMAAVSKQLEVAKIRVLGQGRFGEDRRVMAPPEVGVKQGEGLLAVRGSRYGLVFVARGSIYEEALKHHELECFG